MEGKVEEEEVKEEEEEKQRMRGQGGRVLLAWSALEAATSLPWAQGPRGLRDTLTVAPPLHPSGELSS